MEQIQTQMTEENAPKKVYICLDDHDEHGIGCNCGKCNFKGRSFGISIYPFTCPCENHNSSCLHEEMLDQNTECIERTYAHSEEAAMSEAKHRCQEQNYDIVFS